MLHNESKIWRKRSFENSNGIERASLEDLFIHLYKTKRETSVRQE